MTMSNKRRAALGLPLLTRERRPKGRRAFTVEEQLHAMRAVTDVLLSDLPADREQEINRLSRKGTPRRHR